MNVAVATENLKFDNFCCYLDSRHLGDGHPGYCSQVVDYELNDPDESQYFRFCLDWLCPVLLAWFYDVGFE